MVIFTYHQEFVATCIIMDFVFHPLSNTEFLIKCCFQTSVLNLKFWFGSIKKLCQSSLQISIGLYSLIHRKLYQTKKLSKCHSVSVILKESWDSIGKVIVCTKGFSAVLDCVVVSISNPEYVILLMNHDL